MKFKEAIRYFELNSSDFITDLEEFSNLQKSFLAGYIPDDFTEKYEGFIDKLTTLWLDSNGSYNAVLDGSVELPSSEELLGLYCKNIFKPEKEEQETVFFSSSTLLKRKKDNVKGNKTLDLIVFFGSADIDMSQYLNMELELIYKVIELVSEQKKEQQERERRRKRRGN